MKSSGLTDRRHQLKHSTGVDLAQIIRGSHKRFEGNISSGTERSHLGIRDYIDNARKCGLIRSEEDLEIASGLTAAYG
jgi:hypothetical protein